MSTDSYTAVPSSYKAAFYKVPTVGNTSQAVEAIAPTPKVCPACNSRYGNDVAFCSRDGTPLVTDPGAMHMDLVGQVLVDRYRILRLIGEGGMGQVYEAQHVNINKKFAIKLLRAEITANPEAVARFRQEAWSASSIGHENIIEIDDFATLPNGAVYLAMEYLAGRALSDRMRHGPPLGLDESLDVLMQVCRGLAAAHDKGIVHRDMKPENVFLAQKHHRVIAKILDFGIAKVSGAEGSSQSLTRTGTIFGTPHYMSPEQALGRPLDHRTDIYSVGVILYELFTGRVPFEAESFMGILTKHITAQPTPPTEMAPDRQILPAVETVILRAMAKELPDRYQTMGELLVALEAIASEHAPHVLTTPSGSISAQMMLVRTPSQPMSAQMARQATPSGMQSARVTPLPARGSGPLNAVPAATVQGDALVVPQHRAGIYVALVLVGLGVAGFVWRKQPDKKADPVVQKAVVPETKEAATKPVEPLAPDVEILIESEPLGAEILRDGARLGDTPWNIVLAHGQPETIALRKAGYATKSVLLRSDGEKRRIIQLVKEPGKHAPSMPIASPITSPPVTKPPLGTKPTSPPPPIIGPPPNAPPMPNSRPHTNSNLKPVKAGTHHDGSELLEPYK